MENISSLDKWHSVCSVTARSLKLPKSGLVLNSVLIGGTSNSVPRRQFPNEGYETLEPLELWDSNFTLLPCEKNCFHSEVSVRWRSAGNHELKNLPHDLMLLLAPPIVSVTSPQLLADYHHCIWKLSCIHSSTTGNLWLFFISKIEFVYIKNINFMLIWSVLISERHFFIYHWQHGCSNVPHLIN